MKNHTIQVLIIAAVSILLSACGNGTESVSSEVTTPEQPSIKKKQDAQQEPILIIIDQRDDFPGSGNQFSFGIEKVPEGYTLAEMKWESDHNRIVDTLEEAMERGDKGGDGFSIGGSGNFSYFFYPDKMKGEQGQVIFLFRNDEKDELIWKKTITLK
ncbi:hypothetical protein NQ117_00785 [Paenibacillus sp. SC116]|uniref:hypothetical protein n=1 Tax=Paenibacillus sp. SC116 TaxID=2968986 RepID=UPI00215AB5F3|nr:hypothetical protein [Paenibacillus sp. SC116]MCR8842209.1 hypothetical protein [Paenibacillus sp. SC116]